jgi:hypothetical protein
MKYLTESLFVKLMIALALTFASVSFVRDIEVAFTLKIASVIVITLLISQLLEPSLNWLKRFWQILALLLLLGLATGVVFDWK